MEWVFKVLGFLNNPTEARAIILAILAGLFFTQWVKFQLPEMWSDDLHKRITRAIGTLLTSGICCMLWPIGMSPWFVMAGFSLVTGLASPTIYWVAMKVIYRKWPWLNDMMSARPDAKDES